MIQARPRTASLLRMGGGSERSLTSGRFAVPHGPGEEEHQPQAGSDRGGHTPVSTRGSLVLAEGRSRDSLVVVECLSGGWLVVLEHLGRCWLAVGERVSEG